VSYLTLNDIMTLKSGL